MGSRRSGRGVAGPDGEFRAADDRAAAEGPAAGFGTSPASSLPPGAVSRGQRTVLRAAAAERETRGRQQGETQAETRGSSVALRTSGDGDDERPGEGPYLGSFPPESSRHLDLRGSSPVVPRARDFTRRALRDWGWLPAADAGERAAAEDTLPVVSELVTNAALHAEGPDALHLHRGEAALRIEVEDSGRGEPATDTPPSSARPGGHGMFIVQRLSLDWGVHHNPGSPGKTVWAEVATPDHPVPQS